MASADDKSFDDINVTPMVDLYLVLLLIFIIMTTAGVQGVKVNLPSASAKSAQKMEAPKTQAITIDSSGSSKAMRAVPPGPACACGPRSSGYSSTGTVRVSERGAGVGAGGSTGRALVFGSMGAHNPPGTPQPRSGGKGVLPQPARPTIKPVAAVAITPFRLFMRIVSST